LRSSGDPAKAIDDEEEHQPVLAVPAEAWPVDHGAHAHVQALVEGGVRLQCKQ